MWGFKSALCLKIKKTFNALLERHMYLYPTSKRHGHVPPITPPPAHWLPHGPLLTASLTGHQALCPGH